MHLVRRALIAACAGALIVGAYLAGSFTAGLLVGGTRAMAAPMLPVQHIYVETADRVA